MGSISQVSNVLGKCNLAIMFLFKDILPQNKNLLKYFFSVTFST